jgi:4-hydroxy-tetrahydrodipicolinate synthase
VLQNLADGLIANGAHGLVVCGTTGEASQLDIAEQGAALAAVLEVAHKRCPVLMGIGGSDTFAAAAKALQFDDTALAGYLVSTPAYVRPSQEGLVRHFEAIAEATAQPIVLYNVPARTGVNLELATARRLAVDPQFVGIKEAGGNLQQMTELVRRTPLSVLCGDDALLFAALCGGGHGAISAAAHIRVDLFVRLYDLVRAQRLAEARDLFDQLLPIIRLLFSEPNPAPLKAALSMQGRLGDELRLPMTPASTECKLGMAAALEELDRIPVYHSEAAIGAGPAQGAPGAQGVPVAPLARIRAAELI